MRFEFLDTGALEASPLNTRVPTDLDALVASIGQRGVLRAAVVTSGGRVLGGWHRKLACERLGVPLPSVIVPNLSASNERVVLMTDNDITDFAYRPPEPLRAELVEDLGDGWWSGKIVGDVGAVSMDDRWKLTYLNRSAARGVRGSVLVSESLEVADDWVWACWYAMTGEPAPVRVSPHDIDVASAAIWHLDPENMPHPSMGRFGVITTHRRVSPLWRWMMEEGEPGTVLDIGCGWAWHHAQVPTEWRPVAYEPYRRAGSNGRIDKRWVRNAIHRVAHEVRQGGLFDHVTLDHVLFLTGSDEAAITAVDAAAALVAPGGSVWISSYWHETKSSGGRLDNVRRINGRGRRRYLIRTWPREELEPLLQERFESVELKHGSETHLYRCQGPQSRDLDAVRAEFDLEWDDGTRPDVVDDLMEALT